jgi:hypothetical protein
MAQQMVTLAEQKMKDGSTKLKLVSPFVPGFSDKARALGGTWNPTSKAWYFDTRDVRRIRDLVLSTYGADPLAEPGDEPELVTVRVALDYPDDGGQIWMFGRELASRSSRDYSARLGEGVVVISGGFPRSGGSAKTPRVAADSAARPWARPATSPGPRHEPTPSRSLSRTCSPSAPRVPRSSSSRWPARWTRPLAARR